jgi:hypothetical protein
MPRGSTGAGGMNDADSLGWSEEPAALAEQVKNRMCRFGAFRSATVAQCAEMAQFGGGCSLTAGHPRDDNLGFSTL